MKLCILCQSDHVANALKQCKVVVKRLNRKHNCDWLWINHPFTTNIEFMLREFKVQKCANSIQGIVKIVVS